MTARSRPGRRIRYRVACSLDGYIAGPKGEYDWIVHEPTMDFAALFAQFDTLLMGRKTFDLVIAQGQMGFFGKEVVVVSRSLNAKDHPDVTIVSRGLEARVRELRDRPGKDIWLFGGGQLFRSLLDLGLVDTVEPAIVPVLLGGGVPFLPTPALTRRLTLTAHKVFPSGIVWLEYTVQPAPARKGKIRKKR
ncbi:MAG TPA: dihydrofolate reductase family protein [Gemmatimonadota bacterium]|nr:dihydrofolate reductase family protein [Gemmatimonadota bacterium]